MRLAEADTSPAWCPGCGNFPILETLQAVLDESGIDPHKLVLVSGIGQAAKLPHYPKKKVNVFNGLHGRALPAATAIKLANHELTVMVTSGDGDMYGEGGNHFLHAVRRNVSVKAFVHDNQVYGLTKGQASPTSERGFVTTFQPGGVAALPFNPLALAIVEEAAFVARAYAGNKQHLQAMMRAALEHQQGFCLLDILQPCVSFNRLNSYKWYRDRVKEIDESHDPSDKAAALKLAFTWGEQIPVGILYKSGREGFESRLKVLEKGPMTEQFKAMGT